MAWQIWKIGWIGTTVPYSYFNREALTYNINHIRRESCLMPNTWSWWRISSIDPGKGIRRQRSTAKCLVWHRSSGAPLYSVCFHWFFEASSYISTCFCSFIYFLENFLLLQLLPLFLKQGKESRFPFSKCGKSNGYSAATYQAALTACGYAYPCFFLINLSPILFLHYWFWRAETVHISWQVRLIHFSIRVQCTPSHNWAWLHFVYPREAMGGVFLSADYSTYNEAIYPHHIIIFMGTMHQKNSNHASPLNFAIFSRSWFLNIQWCWGLDYR